MKKPSLLFVSVLTLLAGYNKTIAQCPTGYTQAQLNWDNLSFFNSGIYGTGVSTAAITTQNFAFGTQKLTINHSYTGTAVGGDNTTNTGETGSYGTGADIQFTGDGTVTFTFLNAVQNVKFSVYDIDVSQKVTITALNGATAQSVTIAKISGTVLGTPVNGTSASVTATSSPSADNSTDGTINVDIAGPVTSFKLTISNTGVGSGKVKEDGSFWISDITACSSGSFPTNYQKTGLNQPFTGQPDYFLTTPDNNSAYMLDPATGKAYQLFTETGATYINSFAYDPYHHILYYVVDGSTSASTNKKIRKYDYNTETSSDFVADITTLGIPTFDQGVESAAASYFDGALYLGIEGGIPNSSSNRKSIVWRINIDATTGNPSSAYQVYGVPSNNHDWGDFMIKGDTLYDFNTSTASSGSQIKHFNLVNGSLVNYSTTAGQVGMTWAGDLYAVRNVVEKYNQNGTKGTAVTITTAKGTAWVGNAGDASGPFHPKADFGDAPATYDPDPLAPAVHEIDSTLIIGTKVGKQWKKNVSSTASADTTDDGLTYVRILSLSSTSYSTEVKVYNHSGASATVGGWVDFNNDGVFQSNEGVTQTVPSSTAAQTITLYWTNISTTLADNSHTFLRIRMTSAANNMTISNPTGYYNSGEVEDYYVTVYRTTLAIQSMQFDAVKANNKVQLNWNVRSNNNDEVNYTVAKSPDAINWQTVTELKAGTNQLHTTFDAHPLSGKSYYRLQLTDYSGKLTYSTIKTVSFDGSQLEVNVLTNPAVQNLHLSVYANECGKSTIYITDDYAQKRISKEVSLQKGYNSFTIPVGQLSSGFYIINLQKQGILLQKKIIINN